ncbi:MAG: aminoglycoside phosphotransferase (APT) family kinase protein [Candidatus Aldehydirespiratoraceae bacterium]|jgi:aminoglycoside phosphotransferase (APT) family kinase protein
MTDFTRQASDDDDASRTEGLIDPEKLGVWMDEQGLPGEGDPIESRFISGGASNEIFEVKRGGERWALRRPPRVVPKGRNETMLREYRIIDALSDTDVPHCKAWGVCEDTSILGSTFYLMEFIDGWSPISEPEWPEPFFSNLDARPPLAYELVDAIARLSNVDWKARGLEGLGRPDGFHDRQVDRWLAHLDAFKFRELPGLDEAATWLRNHKPRSYKPGIMHGDYQFANVMFHHGGPARMAAIVDWEMGTIGDPLLDLAWVVMGWPDADEDRGGKGYVDHTGMPDKADLLERYATISGRDVDEIDYYVILARFKMAIVLEGGYARFVQGGADNPKMASFGEVVLDMATKAAELVATTKLS